MRFVIGAMGAALALAACGEAPSGRDTVARTAGPDTCNAAAYVGLIGQDAVQALVLPEPKRSYRLGEPVTTDFIANRLNVKLDETDTIVAIDCG